MAPSDPGVNSSAGSNLRSWVYLCVKGILGVVDVPPPVGRAERACATSVGTLKTGGPNKYGALVAQRQP